MQKITDFKRNVLAVVKKIPQGEVLTYNEVASSAGYPKAYRAVANIMRQNFDKNVPCHRVVRSDGTLGEYNRGGTSVKRKLLIAEGFIIK